MTLQTEDLLVPVEGEAPAGPDLAYDPERQLIESAFDHEVSIDASGQASPSRDVDWDRLVEVILAQARRTRDVWLGVYLSRAGVEGGRLDVAAEGLEYLTELIDRFWADLHPLLQDYGPQGRTNACQTLAGTREFLNPLMRLVLIDHPRLGAFSAGDVIRFHNGGEAEEGHGQFRAALAEASPETLETARRLADRLKSAAARLDRVLGERVAPADGANLAPLLRTTEALHAALLTLSPAITNSQEPAEPTDEIAPAALAMRAASAEVNDREQVLRHLDLIASYYRRYEPSSPVPLLIERARGWVNAEFMAILEDLAPSGAEEAGRLLRPPG